MNEEQNILPKDWKWVKLGEVLSVSSGKGLKVSSLKGGQYPVYGGNGLNGMHSEYFIEEPKLIIGRVGAKCGVTHITKPKSWVTDNALIVEPKVDAFDIKFLKLKLGYENLNMLSVSTAQPVISGSKIYAYEILLPPKSIQQQIVSQIEELFSEIDKGIEEIKTAQQQLKVYRQAVLKSAFEGKLTDDDVKESELPQGWCILKFGQLFSGTPQNGLYKPSSEYGSGTPILRIDGFYDGVVSSDYDYKRVKLTDEEIKRYLLDVSDIVVNRVNSMSHLGKCGLVNSLKEQAVFESNIMKIRVKEEMVIPKYVTLYLSSKKGIKELTKNAKHAVNQASINQTDVSNALIPHCSLEEQQQIVQKIESRLSVCDKIEETITNSLKQAEALRQSILKKAFEGKLL